MKYRKTKLHHALGLSGKEHLTCMFSLINVTHTLGLEVCQVKEPFSSV